MSFSLVWTIRVFFGKGSANLPPFFCHEQREQSENVLFAKCSTKGLPFPDPPKLFLERERGCLFHTLLSTGPLLQDGKKETTRFHHLPFSCSSSASSALRSSLIISGSQERENTPSKQRRDKFAMQPGHTHTSSPNCEKGTKSGEFRILAPPAPPFLRSLTCCTENRTDKKTTAPNAMSLTFPEKREYPRAHSFMIFFKKGRFLWQTTARRRRPFLTLLRAKLIGSDRKEAPVVWFPPNWTFLCTRILSNEKGGEIGKPCSGVASCKGAENCMSGSGPSDK